MSEINIYSPRLLVAAINKIVAPRRFLIETFFHSQRCFDVEKVDIDIKKGNRDVAAFVHPFENGVLVENAGYETVTVAPGYTKEFMPVRPNQTVKRLFGEDLSKPLNPQQRLQRILGENLDTLDTRINRLEEFMAAQALINGKVIIKGKSMDHQVDFGYETGKQKIILSGGSCWDTSTGDPMYDLDDWSEAIAERCGIAPDIVIVGKRVAKSLLDNQKIKDRLDIKNFDVGQIQIRNTPEMKKKGIIYHGTLAPSNLPIYSYSEKSYNPITNKVESLIPDDAVLVGSTNAGCEMLYGLVQNLHALTGLPRFPHSWAELNGSARYVQLESAPLPSLYNVDAFVSARVLS